MIRTIRKINFSIIILTSAIALPAYAATIFETAGNDTFLSSQVINASGDVTINGGLSLNYDYKFSGTINPGVVDYYSIPGQLAGQSYVAVTNNITVPVQFDVPDTVIGTLDELSNVVTFDDDSSPYGDELASKAVGTVNTDGTINIGVTAWDDFGLVGAHTGLGEYDLFVALGDTVPFSDIDFFKFDNLTPGDVFTSEIFGGTVDTFIGLFDDAGVVIDFNDDNPDLLSSNGTYSKLSGVVPDSGFVTLAVTGFNPINGHNTFDLTRLHPENGDYQMAFTSTVPLPASVWLFLSGLGVIAGLKKRKSYKA